MALQTCCGRRCGMTEALRSTARSARDPWQVGSQLLTVGYLEIFLLLKSLTSTFSCPPPPRFGHGEDDARRHVVISGLCAATQEVAVHREYQRGRRCGGKFPPEELRLPVV